MRYRAIVISVLAFSLLLYTRCCGDTIVLKEGQTLTGEILAEKENGLIIDIGVTVLTVPNEKILEYH